MRTRLTMHVGPKRLAAKQIVEFGALLFTVSIGISYLLYPHWHTFSVFGTMWRTLPSFLLAMATSFFLLWYVGGLLRSYARLHYAGVLLRLSACCVGLVVLVPYMNSSAQKTAHNMAALFFVLFAAGGFAWAAVVLRSFMLGVLAGVQIGVCGLEFVLLARFNEHPIGEWVWVILQVGVTATLMVALYITVLLASKWPQVSGSS